jgi:lipopolysaccharide transport system permease protein
MPGARFGRAESLSYTGGVTPTDAQPDSPPAAPQSAPPEPPLTVIEPRPGWALPDFRELWRYRELLYFLALRDIKVRYAQTVLGVGWALAQPLAAMAVFALFLGRVGGVGKDVPNYPLFVYAGMVAWTFFGNTISSAALSVVSNERLVTKIYFPRLAIPLATAGVGLFDLALATALLGGLAAWWGVAPGWSVLLLPLVALALTVAAAGIGVLLSALIVAQRDFKYVLTFGVQLWMFATPSLYLPPEAMSETARLWLPLNPAHGLVSAFRQSALGEAIDWYAFGVSAATGAALALFGMLYFRRVERTFADTI